MDNCPTTKGGKEYKIKKRQPLHYMVLGKSNHEKRMKLKLFSHNIHKRDSKCIKGLVQAPNP